MKTRHERADIPEIELIDISEVKKIVGTTSRNTIVRMVEAGGIPAPIQFLKHGRRMWNRHELLAAINKRLSERNSAA